MISFYIYYCEFEQWNGTLLVVFTMHIHLVTRELYPPTSSHV
jgi:hypothetical protein